MLNSQLLTMLLLFSMLFISAIPRAQAGEQAHYINLVAFQADKVGYKYEAIVSNNLGQLITSMEKHAHVIFATHSSKLQDRDVINLQADVMRMTKQGSLASGGLDCRFIFDDESDEDSAFFSISGICDRLTATDQGTERKKIMVKRKMLSDPSTVFNVWLKLYSDPETGIAIYTDID
ncbi:MAG: hypothetical protein Q9M20_08315 [Mariprofundaceae bacterium]|nr:hypothetical protein [Mariprofundaceae bacterium]